MTYPAHSSDEMSEQQGLFELSETPQPLLLWQCLLHDRRFIATEDEARAVGWGHYRDPSQTGKQLDSVLCPICRKG